MASTIFSIRYLPSLALNGLTSDTLTPLATYQDIAVHGHTFKDWSWGGSTFLFPEYVLGWVLITIVSALPPLTGSIENGTLLARADRDAPNCLSYGHYLGATSGKYRITFSYTCEAKPETGREVGYDCDIPNSDDEQKLDQTIFPFTIFPFIDENEHSFSREVVVPLKTEVLPIQRWRLVLISKVPARSDFTR